MEEHRREQKHVCKFCSKSFGCGRSLGGHMRSHMINDVTSHADGTKHTKKKLPPLSTYLLSDQPAPFQKTTNTPEPSAYVLREKPRRTCKIEHINCVDEKDQPLSASKKLVMDSQSDNETVTASKRKRSKRRRTRYMDPSLSFPTNPCFDNEQEEVALCLIMLSKDVANKKTLMALPAECSDNSESICVKNKESSVDVVEKHDEEEVSFKCISDNMFECTTCNKVFHSYQALGGHRASHKKIKGCYATKLDSNGNSIVSECSEDQLENESEDKNPSKKTKGHECPICLKVFPSGRALGGHKRAHLANQSNPITETPPVIKDFFDLNLPAPVEEDADAIVGFSPWWLQNTVPMFSD